MIVITFKSKSPFTTLAELPSTLDPKTNRYTWKQHTMMTYAMIPQSIMKRIGIVDLYVCMDEDELDDIDLRALAEEFLNRMVLPEHKNILAMHLTDAVLTTPKELGCWKMLHAPMEEIA